jgi:MFS family permease
VFVGGVTVLAARVPAALGGTAQGLFSASAGLATIIGSVAGGELAAGLGIPGLFAACGVLGLIGAAIVAVAVLGPRGDRMGMPAERAIAETRPSSAQARD